jgi:hypothetical protein
MPVWWRPSPNPSAGGFRVGVSTDKGVSRHRLARGESIGCCMILRHTCPMHVTDSFTSTVAVTIPVLMLAATVELGGLADTVNKQILEEFVKFYEGVLDITKLLAKARKASLWQKITLYPKIVDLLPGGSMLAFYLSLAWFLVISFAVACEVLCLLSLASIFTTPALAILCICTVGLLMLLLLATPAARTLLIAPLLAYRKLNQEISERSGEEFFRITQAYIKAIPGLVENNLITSERGQDLLERLHEALAERDTKEAMKETAIEPSLTKAISRQVLLPLVTRSSPPRPHWLTQRNLSHRKIR